MMANEVHRSRSCRKQTAVRWLLFGVLSCGAWWPLESKLLAQAVGLPVPRLLTTTPMGGKVGSQVEITITGEDIDDADQLTFSDRRIRAARKRNAAGQAVIDTAALKTPPGDYQIAFYGAAVAKHKPQPAANAADAKTAAAPKDIVDIVVSEPITIRVQPAEKK